MTQFLFAYGTLKSDQPEHAAHCPTPLSIAPARAPGELWRLREGYPILKIDPALAAQDATRDPVADWTAAQARSGETPPAVGGELIEGELHEYPLASGALSKMDAWENFVPGRKGAYSRRIIWVKDAAGRDRLAWAYVCFEPPVGAVPLNARVWNPPAR